MGTALLAFKDLTRPLDDEGRRLVVSGKIEPGEVLLCEDPPERENPPY